MFESHHVLQCITFVIVLMFKKHFRFLTHIHTFILTKDEEQKVKMFLVKISCYLRYYA